MDKRVVIAFEYMKAFSDKNWNTKIDDIPIVEVALGGQAGLFYDLAGSGAVKVARRSAVKSSMSAEPSNWDFIAINNSMDKTEAAKPLNWIFGVVFHEAGHAVLHKQGKNGSAVKELNACAVELIVTAQFSADNAEHLADAKAFAQARKASGLYAFETKVAIDAELKKNAIAAYRKITGADL